MKTKIANNILILVFIFFGLTVHCQTAYNLYPKNYTYTINNNIIFVSNQLPGSYQFRFQLCSDFSCTQILKDTNTVSSSWPFALNSGNGRYFWRSKVFYESDSTEWSTPFELNIYNPLLENSLLFWISADSISQADNTPVASWEDISLNSYNATQTDPSKQPTYKLSGGLGNKPYVDFNGTKGLITQINNVQLPNNGPLGFVSLAKNRNPSGNRAIFYFGNGSTFSPQYAARSATSSYSNGSYRFWGYNGSGFSFDLNTAPSSTFKLTSGLDNNTNASLFSGGVLSSSSSSGVIPVANAAKFRIGCDENLGSNYDGMLHELLVLKAGVDTAILRKIEHYLDCKYIPRADLGGNRYRHNGLCDSSFVLSPGSGYASYLWSTGEMTSSITVTQFGEYWVSVVDELGYTHFDRIEYKPFLNLNYPETNILCANGSLIWDTQMTGYTVNWSDNTSGVIKNITQPGNYSYTISDGSGCSYSSQIVTISLDTYPITAYLGADTSLCTGNPLSLQVGASETVSYAWQGGASSTQATYPIGATGNYWVESVNVNGCVARDTIFITNAGTAPVAEFSAQNHCLEQLAPISDQSAGVGSDFIAQWQWDLGNGVVINQQTPNYTYPSAGTYLVELYVQSVGGCGAYHYDTIVVYENPSAAYGFLGHCQNQEVLFTQTSQTGDAAISSYAWNFDMPWTGSYNESAIPIPNRIFDQVGSYDVKLVISDANGCKDSIIQTVQIDPSPVPNFVFESTCQGAPIQFLNSSTTQPSSTYFWDFGDNTSSIIVNPQHTYPDYGINAVSLSVTNLYACTATATQNVEVYAIPLTALEIGSACMDSYVTLENTTSVPMGAVDSTLWVINQTDTLYGLNSAWMVNSLGQQQVELFTWSAQGCAAQTSQFFDVSEQFNASFSTYPGIIAVGQPFTFENTSNAGSIALWTFGDGGFSTDFSPEHTYDMTYADSTLDVLLIAMNPSGCVDTSFQQVQIQRARIDLDISNLFLQKDGNWYVMGVSLKNKGTVDLQNASLVVETPKGLLFNETWNGVLKPTEDSIYVFSAMPTSIFNDQDAIESYICVSGVGYDLYGTAETYLDNNKVCRNVEGESVVLLPVFPNPISQDFLVRMYLTNSAEVTLSLDDARGRSVQTMENGSTLQAGYYEYEVDADRLAEGTYFINLRSNDETKSFKLSVIK